MNSYTGLHAQVYDEIYAEKPYADEARFVHDLAGAPGGKLLDVACGTGRHAVAFADLGYDVTACDINDELLAAGRAAAGSRIRFLQADMSDLRVEGGPFDLVTCLFDSIGYPQTNERILSALESLGRQVARGGSVVWEFLHAPAILRGATPVRVRRLTLRDGRNLVRTSETTIDVERMLMHVEYELWAVDGDGAAEHSLEQQTNRVFTVPEMRLLAETAGLRVRTIVPAYANDEIGPDTFHVLVVAEVPS